MNTMSVAFEVWALVVSQATHPHWVTVVVLMVVSWYLTVMIRWDPQLAPLPAVLFVMPVSVWVVLAGGLPGGGLSTEWISGLGAFATVIGMWAIVGLGSMTVRGAGRMVSLRFRMHRKQTTRQDVWRLLYFRRYWRRCSTEADRETIWHVVRAHEGNRVEMVAAATVGDWYLCGESPARLAVALTAGIRETGLHAHMDGTRPLDWDTLGVLAALRSPV